MISPVRPRSTGASAASYSRVEGTAARSLYENGISGSSVVDQSYRDNNVFGGRLRLGYETPLGLTPFVEGEVDRRQYDQPL